MYARTCWLALYPLSLLGWADLVSSNHSVSRIPSEYCVLSPWNRSPEFWREWANGKHTDGNRPCYRFGWVNFTVPLSFRQSRLIHHSSQSQRFSPWKQIDRQCSDWAWAAIVASWVQAKTRRRKSLWCSFSPNDYLLATVAFAVNENLLDWTIPSEIGLLANLREYCSSLDDMVVSLPCFLQLFIAQSKFTFKRMKTWLLVLCHLRLVLLRI